MKASIKRLVLRIVHLIAVIPVLGYIYQPVAEVAEYQQFTQLVFIPVAILTGFWMYMGFVWAIIGAVSWVALNNYMGFGIALLAQIVLFIARKIWMITQGRSSEATA